MDIDTDIDMDIEIDSIKHILVVYSTHIHTVLYFTLVSVFAILASMVCIKSHRVYLSLY